MAFGNILASPRIKGMPNIANATNPSQAVTGGARSAQRQVNRGNQTNINQTLPRFRSSPAQPPSAPHLGPSYSGPAPNPYNYASTRGPFGQPPAPSWNIYPGAAAGAGPAQPGPGPPYSQHPVVPGPGGIQFQALGTQPGQAPPALVGSGGMESYPSQSPPPPPTPGWDLSAVPGGLLQPGQQPPGAQFGLMGGQIAGTPPPPGTQFGAFGGGVPGSPQPPLFPNIFSQINPSPIYSPAQTQLAVNQAISGGDQAAYSQHNYGRPGMSVSSPAFSSMANIDAAGALSGAAGQAEAIRFGDRKANAQHMLGGQLARGVDWLGQAGNAAGFDAANQAFSGQMGQGWLQAMLAGIGGQGRMLGENLSDRDFWAELGLRGDVARNQNSMEWMRNAMYWM